MNGANEGVSDEAIRLAAVALVEVGIYDDDSRHITGYAYKAARAALEAVGLPALLERVEAAEGEVARWRSATFQREADKNAAEGRARIAEAKVDTLAAKVALLTAELEAKP